MILPIVNASTEVVEKIKKMLDDDGVNQRNLRIATRLDQNAITVEKNFMLFHSELTLNDQVQEFDGFNIIVANILLQLYGSFTLTYIEMNGKTEVEITPEKTPTSAIYRGKTLGTSTKEL